MNYPTFRQATVNDIPLILKFIRELADYFDNTYVIDLEKYAPVYDEEFMRNFFLEGHMNPAGYLLTGKMISSYIDWIIRNNPEDFYRVGLIPYKE